MNVDELQRQLLMLQLVTHDEWDAARSAAAKPTVEALVAELEKANVLTPYVVGRLKKGETKGLVLGDHKVMYRNASGSFARVYRAQSMRTGQMVGLKVLRERWATDPKNVAQFHREAELGKRLRHPNIAPIYDIGVTDDFHWFSMEFVVGGNFRDFIKIRKKVEPAETLKYLRDIALGLEYALGLGFTHRDLKMTNVLMSADGVAKLIDFGLAGQGLSSVESDQSRAIEYASLEKGTRAPNNDPRSDIYFLGGIVYELLTGEPPYPRTRDREARASFARYRNVRPIRQLEPTLPQSVVELVDRMLKIDPRQRFQHPREILGETKLALEKIGDKSSADNIAKVSAKPEETKPTVLCVEDRAKHQDMLREYFTKHGYRVLVMTDLQRALNRIASDPPNCAVLMGGAIGDEVVPAYQRAVEATVPHGTAIIAVLAESQRDLERKMTSSEGRNRVLARVATLRDLRQEIDRAIGANGEAG